MLKAPGLGAAPPASQRRAGFVAVAGRPNVGKSAMLNRLAGEKVSIVSHRRQTTRSVIRFVDDSAAAQIVWLDAPGWQTKHGGALNRALNAAAEWAAESADAVVFVRSATAWTKADDAWLRKLPADKPAIGVINKIDLLTDKNALLPMIAALDESRKFAAIIPTSAQNGDGVAALRREASGLLPLGEALFPAGGGRADAADRDFFFAELLREKMFRYLGDELPYGAGVVADSVVAEGDVLKVEMSIWTEKESQKRMIIGRGGAMLKKLATAARLDMERCVGGKVFLSTRARTANWRANRALLKKMRIGAPPS